MDTIARRTERRAEVRIDGRIDVAGRQASVRVRDLSSGGVLLEADDLPAKGAELRLVCRGLVRGGRVTWSDGRRCGIAFTQPLDAATLAALLGEPVVRRA